MRDIDEGSGSEEESFQSRPKKVQRGEGAVNGNGKASKAALDEEGPA